MKRHLLLRMAMLAGIATAVFCTGPKSDSLNSSNMRSDTSRCVVALRNPDSIPDSLARRYKAAWATERAHIQQADPADAGYIVEGFRIHKGDLLGILKAYQEDSTSVYTGADSIWVMLAIKDATPHVLLQTIDRATGRNVHYDFSSPCPPNCPSER